MSSNRDLRPIYLDRGRGLHVEEGRGTHGKADAQGVPRLYVEVHNELGEIVFRTWQNGPLDEWNRVTLYFDRIGVDASGEAIGYSLWEGP